MSLSRKDVEKVALLARLEFSDEELDTLTGQLARVVEYVDLLSELETEDIEPMAHAVDVANVFRADEVCESLPRSQALANAPRADEECYLVPAVLS